MLRTITADARLASVGASPHAKWFVFGGGQEHAAICDATSLAAVTHTLLSTEPWLPSIWYLVGCAVFFGPCVHCSHG